MRNRQEWFNEKMAADIIARIDAILKQKNMTQKDLARKECRGLSCTCMNNNSNNS